MIATDITGNVPSGSAQLLNLLQVVSNPKEYEAKVKALEEATAAHAAIVNAVGPASEIPALRDKAAADVAEAKAALEQAKAQAVEIVTQAKAEAASAVKAAKDEAKSIKVKATALQAEATQQRDLANVAKQAVDKEQIAVAQLQQQLSEKIAAVEIAKEQLDVAKQEVEANKAALRKRLDQVAKAAGL